MSAGESFSEIARSASLGTSTSEAKRSAMSCPSVNSGMRERKRLGQKRSQPQPFFQANHPVLHFQRVSTKLQDHDGCGHGDHEEQSRMQAGVPDEMGGGDKWQEQEDRQREVVIQGIKARVVGERLQFFVGHDRRAPDEDGPV